MRAKHRTRVYISHEISQHDDHLDVQAKTPLDTRIVASHDKSTRVRFSEDKENVKRFSEDKENVKRFSEDKENVKRFSEDKENVVRFSEDKENVDVDLERRDLESSDNFKDILLGCRDTKDEDSGINSTSSSDSQECHKPKLVGILKSPGKRRHFRKHVEFLDKHEGRELDVSIRYF